MSASTARRRLLGGLAGAGLLALAPAGRARAARVLTASDVHVGDYPTVQAVQWLGEQLERQTGGRLALRMYHSGQLGRESEAIDLARFGAIDLTRVYSGALNNAFPLTTALCLPYQFESVAHLRRVLDGPVGARVLEGFGARGLVGLAIYDSGARGFYNTRRPLHAPADLRGLKLRVPPSDVFMALVQALGANPTPLPYGEVYSALQTHLIDGAENNIRSFHSSRQFEAARYWSDSAHSYAPDVLVMSRRTYDALAPADRDRVRALATASVGVLRERWDEGARKARASLLAAGVRMDAVDLGAFRAAAEPVLREYRRDPRLAPLVRGIADLAGGAA